MTANLLVKTLQQYQADIIARFGYLPDLATLAQKESVAMWIHSPGPRWDSRDKAISKRVRVNRHPTVNTQARRALILSALPGDRQHISERTGMSKDKISECLRSRRAEGLADRQRIGSKTIWEVAA